MPPRGWIDFDKETNLHYNYHRWYDPAIGRYTQFDLIGLLGGINGYAYVGGNPLSRIDPTGESELVLPRPIVLPPWAGPVAGVAGAGWAGWELGTLIYPVIEPVLSPIVDACFLERTDKRTPLDRCLDAAAAGGAVWNSFCRSLKDPVQRAGCWARGPESETNKRGWCFSQFGKR